MENCDKAIDRRHVPIITMSYSIAPRLLTTNWLVTVESCTSITYRILQYVGELLDALEKETSAHRYAFTKLVLYAV